MKANIAAVIVYLASTAISTAMISSSTSTRRMSALESELHDEAQRHEEEARHLRRLERVEREHKWEIDELHQLRTAREEQERIRKEREAEEERRRQEEHEELLELRREVARLRSGKKHSSSRPVPPTPTLPEARFPESK